MQGAVDVKGKALDVKGKALDVKGKKIRFYHFLEKAADK